MEALWQKLESRTDMVGEWPPERWDERFFHPDPERPGRIYTRAGGFLDRIDGFDAEFFGMSPREASRLDPQQRMALELAWTALEDSGQVAKGLSGLKAGVFVGVSSSDYASQQVGLLGAVNAYTNAGSALSIVSNRISFFFDFRGPSMSIDTACSSSLVAVHAACQSIWSGESEYALAGGVNILIKPEPFVGFCKASMLARDGRCKSFDASGDGYVRAEGGVMIALKPLSAAYRDHDIILGEIVATAVNSDGRTKGLALPNEEAQEALLRELYGAHRIDPRDVFYVEAHGTGTVVGDPIECSAIGRVLGKDRPDGEFCYIGSIKSNTGHLEPASGVTGIAKVLLALKHREIPANLHFNTPNPKIAFDELKLKVVADPLPIPRRDRPWLFGVNSFGFGGTNAHVVIREHQENGHRRGMNGATPPWKAQNGLRPAGAERPELLLLSAHSPEALGAMAAAYAGFLRQPSTPALAEVCATAALRRSTFYQRLAVLGQTPEEMATRLESFAAGETPKGLATGRVAPSKPAKIAFVFCGNGPQRWGMGRELYLTSPVFRRTVDEIDEIFEPLAGWSIRNELNVPEEMSRMAQTEVAQPMLFALQAGIVEVLREMGISPAATVGHSVGEIAAAYVAGALSLHDAVRVVFARSSLQGQTAGKGKMAAAGMSPEAIAPLLEKDGGWIEIAGFNSPNSVTLSGDPVALERVGAELSSNNVFFRMLALDYAFHSHVMEPIRAPLLEELRGFAPHESSIPFVSTVEGHPVSGTHLGADYWWRNVREPVRFSSAIESLIDDGFETFIEIGPHPVVREYINQTTQARGANASIITTLKRPSMASPEAELDALSTAICACYANGGADPKRLFHLSHAPVALPPYPWQRQPFWIGRKTMLGGDIGDQSHPLLGGRTTSAQPSWKAALDPESPTYLRDHVVQGAPVFPAAGFLEIAAAVANLLHADSPIEVADFEIRKPLVFAEKKSYTLETFVDEEDGSLRITSREDGATSGSTLHALAKISRGSKSEAPPVDLDALKKRLSASLEKSAHYAAARARGIEYGPAFQGVECLFAGKDEVLGYLRVPDSIEQTLQAHRIHPAILDSSLQVLLGLVAVEEQESSAAYLPIQAGAFRLYGKGSEVAACYVHVNRRTPRSIVADFKLLDAAGNVIGEIDHFRFQSIDFTRTGGLSMYVDRWQLDHSRQPRQGSGLPAAPGALSIAAGVADRVSQICETLDRAGFYRSVMPKFDEFPGIYAAGALAELGAGETPFSVDQLAAKASVLPEYRRLLERLVEICRKRGYVSDSPEGFRLVAKSQIPAADSLWQALVRQFPEYIAEAVLLGRCGTNLAGIMRGETSSLKLLFGEATSSTLEQLYDSAPSFRPYNQMAAAAASELCANWPADRPLRVLEVGAGTGGLTTRLLPAFPADRTYYLFTDVTEAFTARAERRFSGFPFVHFGTFDLEKPVDGQGLAPGSFDLIVASDAVHVAADLRAALDRISQLLAPDGLLLLVEKHAEDWVDIIFGTLSGWWNFADHDLRPKSALLSPSAWRDVLKDRGFAEVAVLSDAETLPPEIEWTQHSVFLAQKRDAAPAVMDAQAPEPAVPARKFLLLADSQGPAADFAVGAEQSLVTAGHQVFRAKLLDEGSIPNGDGRAAVANDPDDMAALLEHLGRDGFVPDEIVNLAGLGPIHDSLGALSGLQDRKCVSMLNLIRALQRNAQSAPKPRLTLVSSRANPQPSPSLPSDPAQSPVWGLGRVITNEMRELRCRLIDLHLPLAAASAERLVEELETDDGETEVLLTPNRRYVMRVHETAVSELHSEATRHSSNDRQDSFRLEIGHQGNLDSLTLVEQPRVAPGPGQVEVRIHAAGLNFRDVMWAMGLLPEEALEGGFAGPTIGMECAGVVERVGPGVEQFTPGDRVIAFGSFCFASYMVTDKSAVARIPDGIDFEPAATIPTAFFTAYYSLEHLAHLEAGERILIHGAAGGVGLAAIQIAQRRGAEIFATAGSNEKRDILRMLGVDHVLDSRSLLFADEIMRLTGGAGVDVVLNSLAGEAIWKNLRILRPFGRFIELGKRDFYANSKIGLRPFRNNLTYFGVDLDQMLLERKALGERMMKELMGLFATGELTPLPHRVFPIDRASEAFRHLQQSRHIGKLIITPKEKRQAAIPLSNDLPIRGDATYLVTGGLTGFGLATAQWLVSNGARYVALSGRRGRGTDEAEAGIAAMESAGARVKVFATDVTDEAAMTAMIAEIRDTMPPLRGIVHSAMVLDDGVLLHLDHERFHRALDPKILGAWLLHRLTLNDKLDFFVLYSSATALVGNPGQGNYVSGCYYLEALADYRRTLGLPALAIGWAGISDVGYVARNDALREILEGRAAIKTFTSAQGFVELGKLLAAGATRATVGIDLQKLRKILPCASAPKYSVIFSKFDDGETVSGGASDFLETLKAMQPGQRRQAMVRRLTQLLSRVMGISAAQLPDDRPLPELGIDSLMAVEFGGMLEDELGVKIPAMQVVEGSLADAGRQMLEMLGLDAEPSASAPVLDSVQAEDIEKMDEQQVDQLLEELTRENA
jgi:phthiocerol/phenolphthiocerol synthesis type-I polyketide synthase C